MVEASGGKRKFALLGGRAVSAQVQFKQREERRGVSERLRRQREDRASALAEKRSAVLAAAHQLSAGRRGGTSLDAHEETPESLAEEGAFPSLPLKTGEEEQLGESTAARTSLSEGGLALLPHPATAPSASISFKNVVEASAADFRAIRDREAQLAQFPSLEDAAAKSSPSDSRTLRTNPLPQQASTKTRLSVGSSGEDSTTHLARRPLFKNKRNSLSTAETPVTAGVAQAEAVAERGERVERVKFADFLRLSLDDL